MKKLIISIFLLASVSACVSTAPKQFYRAAGETEQVSVSGEFKAFDGWHGSLMIKINNEIVISEGKPASDSFELSGLYEDKKVDAVCNKHKTSEYSATLSCLILINNERAATLTFNY